MENGAERQQKVPYKRQNVTHSHSGEMDKPVLHDDKKPKTAKESFQLPFGIGEILNGMDTDTILIIILLAVLYKDGGSSKLMLALVYLLI
ncbi:MAG: hypothetical protein ACI4JN_10510 [Ruminococcus sp.]